MGKGGKNDYSSFFTHILAKNVMHESYFRGSFEEVIGNGVNYSAVYVDNKNVGERKLQLITIVSPS
jgi:hypothetical protein